MPTKATKTTKSAEEKATEASGAKTSSANQPTPTNGESGAEIAETFGGSPITTTVEEGKSDTSEIDLSKATITVPSSAIKTEGQEETPEPPAPKPDNSLFGRANQNSIGLIRVEGIDFRYVGKTPVLDDQPTTPSGYPITSENSTFTPLSEVGFDRSLRVRIGKEYFFPTEATGWGDVELNGEKLIPEAK